jgi:hypothetical protein
MKTLNTKLVLSAVAIALLGTPAFAQKPHRQAAHQAAQHQVTTGETDQTVIPSSSLYGGSYGE